MRWVTLVLALSFASAAHAQDVLSMDHAADEAIAQSPTLMAAVLTARSAQRLVIEQENYYQFMLQLDANGMVGNTPQLSPTSTAGVSAADPTNNYIVRPLVASMPTGTGIVTNPYSQTLDLGAQLSRALPWGMTVLARLDGIRTYRAVLPTATSQSLATIGPGYGFNATFTVTQSLLRGFGETVGYAPLYQARADRAGFDATRDRTASGLLRDMLVAYWELWYAERALEIQHGARDVIQRQRDEAQRRTDLGALAAADVLTLEAQLATIDSSLAASELAVANAAATLARLLGRREGSTPHTQPEPPQLAPVAAADALRTVVDSAPEVIEARARIESARIASTIAGQALMPVLNIGATFEVLGLGYNDVGQTFSNFGSFTAVQFLGTLTYQTPLDDVQIHMEQERAQIAIQIAEQNFEAARAQALADATAALRADEAATRRVALTEHAVDVAQQALAAQEERLTLGSGLVINVLSATQTLRQAELDRARAEVDAQEARVRLLHLLGQLLARFDERLPD
jgi:outer membrane protein TolC